jgi:hypothetical protein
MVLFERQQAFLDAALTWLRAADAEYAEAREKYQRAKADPKLSWQIDQHRTAMRRARAKAGYCHWGDTGVGKTRPMQLICLTKARETKRSSITFLPKGLIGSNAQELLEMSRDDGLKIGASRILVIQGSPREKLAILERVKALSGVAWFYCLANPEAVLPPTSAEAQIDGPQLDDALPPPDADEYRDEGEDTEAEKEKEYKGDEADIQLKVWQTFCEISWSVVNADEFQRTLSSTASRVYRHVFLRCKADWRIGSSATAFPYKPRQFAAEINYFQPGRFWRSTAEFVRTYFELDKGSDRVKNVHPGWEGLWTRLQREVGWTCTLDEVAELPPVTFVQDIVELHPAQRQAYDQLKINFIKALDDAIDKEGYSSLTINHILPKLLRFKQVCVDLRLLQQAVATARPGDWIKNINWQREPGKTSAKIDRVVDLFFNSISEVERMVVFTQWTASANLILSDFAASGIKSDLICGATKSAVKIHKDGVWSERLGKCHDFNWGKTELMVITKAAGEGLSLQRANHVVIMDPPYRFDELMQPIGRVRRPVPPGMPGPFPVTARMMVARNTIEQSTLIPRLFAAGRAAGIFTRGVDLADTPTAGLFTGMTASMDSLLDRDSLVAGL